LGRRAQEAVDGALKHSTPLYHLSKQGRQPMLSRSVTDCHEGKPHCNTHPRRPHTPVVVALAFADERRCDHVEISL
jgi:hypothetical protein